MTYVSISSEMPGPWRPLSLSMLANAYCSFNLKRDARPLATVSRMAMQRYAQFQSQARCQAPGDHDAEHRVDVAIEEFQSQARCQAPGDVGIGRLVTLDIEVSISSEMPGPWRRRICETTGVSGMFQSQARCQAPGDLPHAASKCTSSWFQSQARCQAPGDCYAHRI